MNLPLQGLKVLEFSQYLSGPSAGLRLADLGARVIKIERPGTGDACRQLSIKNMWADESSLLFHTINRNKESFAADLKNTDDLVWIKRLIAEADIVTHNFRPGVMNKLGLDYESVKKINPLIIYAEISGYGTRGPWKNKPGQDLLLQAMSGLAYTTGNEDDLPVPFGIAIADIFCGAHLVQGVLAALVRRQKKGIGALIEVSLLESLLDFQFELLTTYYTSSRLPLRSKLNNGHPLLSAPYGLFRTKDGFVAIAMVPLSQLAKALQFEELNSFSQEEAFIRRDEIKHMIAGRLINDESHYWIELLEREGLWVMEVLNWQQMQNEEAYRVLKMEQEVMVGNKKIITTRCPLRINGKRLFSQKGAPKPGQHTQTIKEELIKEM